MKTKSRHALLLLSATLAFGALAATSTRGAAADDFPMKKWMQVNMGAKKDDARALAPAFQKVIAMSPDPAWADWKTMSEKGAKLATEGKLEGKDGASQVCKDCHVKYKDEYKAKYRTRPLPSRGATASPGER